MLVTAVRIVPLYMLLLDTCSGWSVLTCLVCRSASYLAIALPCQYYSVKNSIRATAQWLFLMWLFDQHKIDVAKIPLAHPSVFVNFPSHSVLYNSVEDFLWNWHQRYSSIVLTFLEIPFLGILMMYPSFHWLGTSSVVHIALNSL